MQNNVFQLTSTSVPKAFLSITLPVVLSMVVTIFYNIADTWFITLTHNTDLIAGVSISAPVFIIFMSCGNLPGHGGASLISRMLGKKEFENVNRLSAFCFYLSLSLGICLGIALLLFRHPLLHALGADADTMDYAMPYYFILSLGSPAIVFSFTAYNLLRSVGLTREPMIGMIAGALINIVLDPVFIFRFGMGAGGAALATVLGYVFSIIYYLFVIVKCPQLSLQFSDFRAKQEHALKIWALGLPTTIINLMQSASIIFINLFLLPYGNDKIAAMGVALKISNVVLLIITGFSFGSQPLFGYLYGMNAKDRLSLLLRFSFSFVSIVSAALSFVVCCFSPVLVKIFFSESSLIEESARMLRCQTITMVFVGLCLIIATVLQAFGKAKDALAISVCRQGILYLITLLVFSTMAGYSGILWAQAGADAVTCILSFFLFAKIIKQ